MRKNKITLDEMAAQAFKAGVTYGKIQQAETLRKLKEQEEKQKKVETPSAR